MSYILDALRRADAERQQGGVPGLHSPAGPQTAPPTARPPWLWWGSAALALLVAVAALLWWWARPAPVTVVVASPPPATAVLTPPAPAPTPAPTPAPLPIVVSAAPAPSVVQPSAPSAPPAPPAPPAAEVRILKLAQLPAEQRRELPPLVVGGSVWSDSAASRFVILDGQVSREGDSLAPGLVLERIQPKGVILRWRDMRIELAL